jgi:hypothetical protein
MTTTQTRTYRAQVIADDSGKWCGNALTFATPEEARAYAVDLEWRWTLVRDWRVIDDTGTVVHTEQE